MPNTPLRHEQQESRQTLHEGRIVSLHLDAVSLWEGGQQVGQGQREVVLHPGAVCVLPVSDAGEVLLVRQFRYATGDFLWEAPAGKLDVSGEAPLAAAQRELAEETGFAAQHWQELGFIYTAPGFCNERIYLFVASGLTPLEGGATPEEDESIEAQFFSPTALIDLVQAGQLQDAKTLALLALRSFQSASEYH